MTAPAILMPKAGETVIHDGNPTWLYAACELLNVAYVCLSCAKDFPTKPHLALHVKDPGVHQVVRYCSRHGLEACPPKQATE